MNDRKFNRLVKKSLSTADLGRTGAGLESEMAKGERLKCFRPEHLKRMGVSINKGGVE